jgi:shikimate dehydrogenase
VDVLVRDPARTGALRATAERCEVELRVGALGETSGAGGTHGSGASRLHADLVVSTLPAGAADVVADAVGRPGQTVLDVVYEPWPTALAAVAGRSGAQVLSGALMLLHQAAQQVQLMTGRPAPIEAMRAALRSARPNAGL